MSNSKWYSVWLMLRVVTATTLMAATAAMASALRPSPVSRVLMGICVLSLMDIIWILGIQDSRKK